MPLKVKKVTIPTIAASVLFNGSNQYLSVANTSTMQMGTSDYTVEAWIYPTANGQANGSNIFGQTASGVSSQFIVFLNSSNKIGNYIEYAAGGGSAGPIITGATSITLNTWTHIATSRVSGVTRIFINGVLDASASDAGGYRVVSHNFSIGSQNGAGSTFFTGYISNLRVIKGTGLYASNFTPSTTPLTAIANTSLLTCHDTTIRDASTNNFTVTNNNTATVSTVSPFIAASPGSMKFKKTSTGRIGRSVLFDGSNQYLSVANTGLFGSGNWTFECWINAPVGQTDKPIIETRNSAGGAGSSTGFTVTMITPTEIRLWSGSERIRATINYVNQWLHIAVVKNNTTTTMYFNGVSVGTTTLGDMSDTSFIVGAGYYGVAYINVYGNFYASNMRVVKGSAVYTSNFTPPTAPLTAITNTALLTCQSPTIVDSSTNNFTITNNNAATVSTTNPFGADTVSGTFKVIKPRGVFMIATGGDLITTSGSYKIHTFTTVGTSSFVVSSLGSTPVIECLLVGGGGGGGGRAMAGGGGGGGVVYTSSLLLATGSFSTIVGAGGIAATGMQASSGQNGGNTLFTYNSITTTVLGGGGGATEGYVGLNGANGGGGTNGNGAGGAGTGGGFPGGSGSAENYLTRGCGGGGGGAGGAGVRGMQGVGGDGGVGAIYNITGSAYYGGGGGGGGNTNAGGATAGAGGLGGGGLGGRTSPGTAGTANTGGGGGGGGYTNTTGAAETNGGNGGSGIILIKYRYTD
jgi:hypothetical protein